MAIESDARQYVRVKGLGKPEIRRPAPSPPKPKTPLEEVEERTEQQGIPDDTTLTRNAIASLEEQGYTSQGAMIEGRIVPYGGFTVRFQSGREVTPQNYNELVSASVEEQRYQYRLSGSYYGLQGFEPEKTEEGIMYVKREEPQVTTQGYIPQRGDVQREPGGPIVNVQQQDARGQISQGIADILGLSRMETQEPYVMTDQYGNPMIRQEMLERDMVQQVPSERDIAIGLLHIPQGAFFVSGFKAIPEIAIRLIPKAAESTIRAVSSAGSIVTGAAFGVMGAKQFVEEPSAKMREFQLFVLGGQIASGLAVSGIRFSGISKKISSSIEGFKDRLGYREVRLYTDTGELRLYRHYEILGKDIRSPFYLKGQRAVTFEDLIKGFQRKAYQTNLDLFRYGQHTTTEPMGSIIEFERVFKPKQSISSVKELVEVGTGEPKPYGGPKPEPRFPVVELQTRELYVEGIKVGTVKKIVDLTQTKIIPYEKPSEPKPLSEVLIKKEPEVVPKIKTGQLTMVDILKGRGELIYADEKGIHRIITGRLRSEPLSYKKPEPGKGELVYAEKEKIKSIEFERLKPEELIRHPKTLSDITKKVLYRTISEPVEAKGKEGTVTIQEVKPKPVTEARGGTIESVDMKYAQGSPKLLNLLYFLESGVAMASSHWKEVTPGIQKEISVSGEKPMEFIISGEKPVSGLMVTQKPMMGEIDLTRVVSGEININKIIQDISERQGEKQREEQIPILGSVDLTRQIQNQQSRQMQQQKQMQMTDMITEFIQKTKTTPSVEETGKLKPGIPILLEEGTKGVIGGNSFYVMVHGRQYSHGKKIGHDEFHKVRGSKPMRYDDAMSLGVNVVGKTEKATFKLEPSDEKPKKPRRRLPSWTNEIHKFYNKGNDTWVEHPRYRIDSPGEVKNISLKGGRK